VKRYGLLCGGDLGTLRPLLARRKVPVAPGGVLGWLHHDDAVTATVAALERGRPGQAYNLVHDQPATWAEVLTAIADAVDAAPPRHIPAWMFRLVAPYIASFAIDSTLRVSNQKAKEELDWTPQYPTYHDGVAAIRAVNTARAVYSGSR
jgi:nucleoside-diphosphate-sugar epimerase